MVDVLRGVGQGLESIAAGQRYRMAEEQAQQRRGLHDIAMQQGQIGLRGLERQEKNQKLVDDLSMKATEAWKNQDQNAYRTALGELARVDNQKAVDLDRMWGGLDKTNFTEAAYNLQGSVMIPDDDPEGKNLLLDRAIERIGDPDNPLSHQLGRIKQIEPGEERDRAEMEAIAFAKEMGAFPMQKGREPAKKQKTGAFIVRDPKGNTRIVTGVFSPDTGELEVKGQALPEGYELVSKLGETPEETKERKVSEAATKEAQKQAFKQAEGFSAEYENLSKSIPLYDEAMNILDDAIEKGTYTGTGWLQSKMPKWNEASQRLDNIGNQLGLKVIQSATFGALSEAEMKMAMQTALPRGMKPKALKGWLERKKAAVQKLANYYSEAASFLYERDESGKLVNTVGDWMTLQRARKKIGTGTQSAADIPEFNTIEEAESAMDNLPPGSFVKVGNQYYEVE